MQSEDCQGGRRSDGGTEIETEMIETEIYREKWKKMFKMNLDVVVTLTYLLF